ncbi:MAG: M48 family metalloprotease, partial [Planctomycetota bacterium]
AGLLAHEVVHIDKRHALLSLATDTASRLGSRLFSFGRLGMLRQFSSQLEGVVVQGYSQTREFEADQSGASLASAAGFDPRGLARVLTHAAGRGLAETGYFATHPSIGERVGRLQARFRDSSA